MINDCFKYQKVGSCPPPSLACLLSGLVLIQLPDIILLIFSNRLMMAAL
jgi:hypothetical protein